MCVLAVKPRGVKMPSKNILRQMFKANPDGCGFVSERHFYKTLDFEEFCAKLKEVDIRENCIIHFRFATHGSVCAHNCHPFRERKENLYFAHNGVLPIASKNDMTDSEICFRERFVPIIKDFGINSRELDEAVRTIIGGSRFAFMKDGEVKTYGAFTDVNGVLFSNMRWMRYQPRWFSF